MTVDQWFFGSVCALVVSLVVTAFAARGRASLWWCLLGPLGWIVAAIHSTDHGNAAPKE